MLLLLAVASSFLSTDSPKHPALVGSPIASSCAVTEKHNGHAEQTEITANSSCEFSLRRVAVDTSRQSHLGNDHQGQLVRMWVLTTADESFRWAKLPGPSV